MRAIIRVSWREPGTNGIKPGKIQAKKGSRYGSLFYGLVFFVVVGMGYCFPGLGIMVVIVFMGMGMGLVSVGVFMGVNIFLVFGFLFRSATATIAHNFLLIFPVKNPISLFSGFGNEYLTGQD